MVYRKTELVLATAEAKRAAIPAAALDLIAKHGIENVTTDMIAERLDCSPGMLYQYFGDKDKMIAAAFEALLSADIAAMRAAEEREADSVLGFVAAIAAFYGRLRSPHIVAAMVTVPSYAKGLRGELAGLVRRVAAIPPRDRPAVAGAILGLLCGAWIATNGAMPAIGAARLALQCIGIAAARATKAVERYSAMT